MCGIAGVLGLQGRPVDQAALARMITAVAHRGPDGLRVRRLGSGSTEVGLGHARLRIIDLSPAAAQPMGSDDGTVWIVFNGEIYNFQELRRSLVARGVAFRSASDTEVILRLYEAMGERCLDLLDGMFALAIWDGRRECLLVARDRVGKKPLFYHASPTLFAFASEMKALFQHPDLPPVIAPEVFPAFFLYGYVPSPATFYRGIRKLPPGHVLRVGKDGEVSVEQYWELALGPPPARPPSEAEATATVRELVTAAVRRRMVADVPLGAFLSGGIDSSVVVGVMSQLQSEPVRTFSIGFVGDPHFDETPYARLAAQRFKTAHTEFRVEPEAVKLVERLVRHHDGPFVDSSAVPTYLLSRLTREQVTVALNGDGGDEVFAGYLRFYGALLAERLPEWARGLAGRVLGGLPEWGGHRQPLRRLQRFGASAALPFFERYSRWISVFYEDLGRLLPDQRANGLRPGPLDLLRPHLERSDGASLLNRLLYLNLKTYLLDDLLVKMDRCSMAHGLEARSPFLDRALMEYVFTLPDSMKLRRGRTKVVLRRAFADLLPPEILRRGKMGFGVPLRAWFTGELREYLQDVLLARDARLRGYVDQEYVRLLHAEHLRGRHDHANRLWTLLTFEVWLRNLPSWSTPLVPAGLPAVVDDSEAPAAGARDDRRGGVLT